MGLLWQVVIDREAWLKDAAESEECNAPVTCGAIVRATLGLGVEQVDRKRTWCDDAESMMQRGNIATARAIYAHALTVFPGKKSVWLRAVNLEQKHGSREELQALVRKAVKYVLTSGSFELFH